MILCDGCKGTGSIPSATAFGHPSECERCRGLGRLSFRDLRHGDHACLLYKDTATQLSNALDFLIEGLAKGERILYAWDENQASDIRVGLIHKGVDVMRETERGAIEIVRAQDIYLNAGDFDPIHVLDFYKGYIEATVRAGFTGLRVAAEMTWALKNPDHLKKVPEYEALIDDMSKNQKLPALGICQYNRNRFSADMIRAALDTHGATILS